MANDRLLRIAAAILMLTGSLYLAEQIAKDALGHWWIYDLLHPSHTAGAFDDLIPKTAARNPFDSLPSEKKQ